VRTNGRWRPNQFSARAAVESRVGALPHHTAFSPRMNRLAASMTSQYSVRSGRGYGSQTSLASLQAGRGVV
jgi:hypothetical protein